MMFIYGITIFVCFVWFLKMIRQRRIILKKSPFDIPLILFVSSQVLSTIFSIDRHTSIYGYYGRFNGGLLSIVSFTILYFAFNSNFLSGNDGIGEIKKILKTSLIGSFLVVLWGLPGKLGYDLSCFVFMGQLNNACWTDQFHPSERMFSTLGQPNWLGAYLVVNFFIGLYFFMRTIFIPKFEAKKLEKKEYSKKTKNDTTLTEIILFCYLLLNFSSILFTRSRSALASVFVGLFVFIVCVIFYFAKNISLYKKQFKHIALFLFIIAISVFIFKTGVQKIDRYLDFSPVLKYQKQNDKPKAISNPQPSCYKVQISESLDIRKIVWKGAIDLANK